MENFLEKINKKNIKKYENNMKKLLFFYLKELDSNINIDIIKNLDFIQIWPIIQNLVNNNIDELKNINENDNNFKNDLNNELDLIIDNDINLLNKKRERLNEEIENEENENEEKEENENEEKEENENEENENNNKKIKDNFFSMEELNKFADEFDEIDNNINNENQNDEEKLLKSAPNTISLKPRKFSTENKSQIDSNSMTNEEAEIEALENSEESIKFNQFFDAPKEKKNNKKENLSESESDNENHIFNQIKLIEEKMLNKKEWNMKGEILSNERPKDSLLSNPMDFEVGLKPPPIPTKESTLNLEKIIKNRIKDDLFDDPILKKNYNLNNNNNNNEDDYELNFSKNKNGLSKEIEDFYSGNDKIEEKKEEIKKEIDELCLDLYKTFDILTNQNFEPYLNNQKNNNNNDIIKNIPAIQIEDVGNFVSDNKNNIAQTKDLINTKLIKEKNKVEMNKEELHKIHNKIKRNIRNRIHQKNLSKKLNKLTQEYGSKFEAKIKMKADKQKLKNNNNNNKNEFKSSKFFGKISDLQQNKQINNNNNLNENNKNFKKYKL